MGAPPLSGGEVNSEMIASPSISSDLRWTSNWPNDCLSAARSVIFVFSAADFLVSCECSLMCFLCLFLFVFCLYGKNEMGGGDLRGCWTNDRNLVVVWVGLRRIVFHSCSLPFSGQVCVFLTIGTETFTPQSTVNAVNGRRQNSDTNKAPLGIASSPTKLLAPTQRVMALVFSPS